MHVLPTRRVSHKVAVELAVDQMVNVRSFDIKGRENVTILVNVDDGSGNGKGVEEVRWSYELKWMSIWLEHQR